MTRASLLHILDHVSAISDAEVRELEQLATAFPYCQTAHLLLAKAAHDKGSMLAGQRLRRAATYAPDRQLLRQLIEFQAPAAPPPEADAPTLPVERAEVVTPPPAAEEPPLLLPEALVTAPDVSTGPTEAVVAAELLEAPAAAEPVATPVAALATTEPVAAPDSVSGLPVTPEEATTTETLLLTAAPEQQAESATAENLPAEAVDSAAAAGSPEAVVEVAPEAAPPGVAATDLALGEPVEVAPETTASEVAATNLALDGEEPLPATTPPIHPPATTTSRFASGVGDVSVDYTAYALTAEPVESEAVTAPVPPFYADEEVGYGFDGGSRLGPCLRAHNELTRDLPAAEFFPPDALLLAHAADETPSGAAPSSLAIIERFLQQQPRLRAAVAPPAPDDEQADLSVTSTSATPALASESLALIMVRQGKMTKAIEIYERLMVRQPEKKTYFAAQIDQLKHSE